MYKRQGKGLARDPELLYALCIIVSNSVFDLNCKCSLSMLFGCFVVFVHFVLFCGVEFATFG